MANPKKTRPSPPRLDTRLALRPKEAAQTLGISERTLRALLPDLPHVRAGNVVMIPVEALRDWLRARSEAAGEAAERVAREIVEKLSE